MGNKVTVDAKPHESRNLLILISNTYSGDVELKGEIANRKNLLQSIAWNAELSKIESTKRKVASYAFKNPVNISKLEVSELQKRLQQNKIPFDSLEPKDELVLKLQTHIQSHLDQFRYCAINDRTKDDMLNILKALRKKYNPQTVYVCVSGHGENATGIVNFWAQNMEETTNLAEIFGALNSEGLLNVVFLLDMCRTGEDQQEINANSFEQFMDKKRVIVTTASWRTVL